MRFFLGLSLLALVSIAILAPFKSTSAGTVVTLADYFALGEGHVAEALTAPAGSDGRMTAELAERASRAVVRVRIQHSFRGEAYATTHATGTLIAGGKYVATVAHELDILRQQPDARIEFALTDGRVLRGRKPAFGHYSADKPETDWAWFEVVDPPAELPSLEFGTDATGSRLVLGYPGRHGRDEENRVVLDDPVRTRKLRPLRILCTTSERDSAQLELTAGCVPIGGMSGAPCIDVAGRLVAIQRGVTDRVQDGRAISTLNVVMLGDLRAAVARAEAGK